LLRSPNKRRLDFSVAGYYYAGMLASFFISACPAKPSAVEVPIAVAIRRGDPIPTARECGGKEHEPETISIPGDRRDHCGG